MKSVLFTAGERRDERGAAFTEYVVLVGVVVAFIALVGFSDFGGVLKDKVKAIGDSIKGSTT